MERNSFIFYRSWWESIKDLPENTQLEVFRALTTYAIDGENVDFKEVTARVIFGLMKPQIDANNKRYANGCKGAEGGKLGGRPRRNTPKDTPELNFENAQPKEKPEPQQNPKETPNENENDIYIQEKESIEKKGEPSSPSRTPFKKPTLEELENYVRDNSLNVDCQRFLDYYESCGWRIGSKTMRDWQAAARNWSRKENEDKGRGAAEQNGSNLYRNGSKSYNETKF